MSTATQMRPVATLTQIMDRLVELENTIHDDLVVYRWRPSGTPQLDSGGSLWNWLGTTPNQVIDTGTWRDPLTVIATVGIRHTDNDEDMARIEEYADAFILTVDPEFDHVRPLGGATRRATRENMQMAEVQFEEGISVLAIQFVLTIERDRHITSKSFV